MWNLPVFDPRVWAEVFERIGLGNTVALMLSLAFCLALVARGPAWYRERNEHSRKMLEIKLNEAARKDALNQKVEARLAGPKGKKLKGPS